MLQTLLADRFKLKLHREAREMSVYALVIGNSGPKLQSSMEACGVTTGSELQQDGCIDVGPGEFIVRYARMDSIAVTLGNMLDRPVLDKTGLAGRYDFHIKFDATSQKPYDGVPWPKTSTDPSIFVAIQDLGLRLERGACCRNPRRGCRQIQCRISRSSNAVAVDTEFSSFPGEWFALDSRAAAPGPLGALRLSRKFSGYVRARVMQGHSLEL
jgi:hypothetical protein